MRVFGYQCVFVWSVDTCMFTCMLMYLMCNEREAATIDNAVTKLVRVMPTHIYIYMHADNSGINVTCVFTNMHRHVPAAGKMKKIRAMINY